MKIDKHLSLIPLVILFCIVSVLFLFGGEKRMASIAAPPPEPPRVPVPQPQLTTKESRLHAIQDALQWERDPFALPSFLMVEKKKAEKERVPLKLLAIMEGARGRVAIIDNEVVGKGDTIAGEKVVEIGKETVTLVQEGSKRVITLREAR